MHRTDLPTKSKPRDFLNWTPEIVERLKELWMGGMPAVDIGRELFPTRPAKNIRNAIIGKAHRLGLSKPTPARRGMTPKPRATRRSKPHVYVNAAGISLPFIQFQHGKT